MSAPFGPKPADSLAGVRAFDPLTQMRSMLGKQPWDSITDFAMHKSFCGKRLYPRQLTLLKLIYLETENMTAYDIDVIEEWREGFKRHKDVAGVQPDVWDRIDYLKSHGYHHFPHILSVMGRRASKGIIGSILGAERLAYFYSLDDWQSHYGLDPGTVGELMVVATSQQQAARRQFADIRRTVEKCEYLKRALVSNRYTEFDIRTPSDVRNIQEMQAAGIALDREYATLHVSASSSVSTSSRGGTGIANFYDEMAHMLMGSGSTKSGEEIYNAFQPSLDQFGADKLTYVASSPFTKIGQFYELYKQGRVTMDEYNAREGKLEQLRDAATDGDQDAETEMLEAVAEPEMLVVQLPSWSLYEDWNRSSTIPILPNKRHCFTTWKRPVQVSPYGDSPENKAMARMRQRNPEKFKVERCVDPDTRVLCADFVWRRIDDLVIGDRLVALDEHPPHVGARQRRMRTAVVAAKEDSFQIAYRMTFDDGSQVVCSGTHRWLSAGSRGQRGFRWRSLLAQDGAAGPRTIIKVGDHIRYVAEPWERDESWEAGYLAGFFDGEGTFKGRERSAFEMSFSQLPGETAEFVLQLLKDKGFSPVLAKHCPEELVGTWDEKQHRTRSAAISWRIYGLDEVMRFIGSMGGIRLARRATGFWEGRGLPRPYKRGRVYKTITSIEELPAQRLVDITTTTGTFIAEGLVSHNCGQFASVVDAYLDENMVDRMFAPVRWLNGGAPLEQQDKGKVTFVYRAHGDPGRTNSNFGFAIAHLVDAPCDGCGWEGPAEMHLRCPDGGHVWPHVVIDKLKAWKPEDYEDHTIDYVAVGEEIDSYLGNFMTMKKLSFDQWNSAGFIASLKKKYGGRTRVVETTFTERQNQERFERFKSALNLGWIHSPKDNFFEDGQCLLELELKFLAEKNGKVIKQEFGPVTTKDLADAVMVCVTDLLHNALDRHYAINRAAVGSTNTAGLRSGSEFERMVSAGLMSRQQADRMRGGARGQLDENRRDRASQRREGGMNRARGKDLSTLTKAARNPFKRWLG